MIRTGSFSRAGFCLAGIIMLNAVFVSQAAADERLDRKSYRTVPGEVYHVLAGVHWYDGEGGSLLFNRLDGEAGTKSWFVDFLGEDEASAYVWPENCNIELRKYKPGSGVNVMEEGWLREHDALFPYRDSYPVSGFDLPVLDTLKSGSLDDAARLVMDLDYLFRAPMMEDDVLTWQLENDYNPEKQTLSFSVKLADPGGVASEWDFSYSRNPETGAITHLTLRFLHADLSDREIRADALTENFNILFLYRLCNYLSIYHTEKWPAYTLKYPDAMLRFNSGESGGGYGWTIELM